MFTPGRYVVIDDDKGALQTLVDALHRIGAPCVAYHYRPEAELGEGFLLGVRILFLDLHLVPGIQMGNHEAALNSIVELLDRGIDPSSGPYIIVLWSTFADQRDALEKRLDRLDGGKRPLALLVLDKKNYDLEAPTPKAGEKLKQDVMAAIATDPRLHALLSWERGVLSAAGATLAHIGDLVPKSDRTPAAYGDHIDKVLSELAAAAVGKKHVADDVRGAVNAALAPILADRILNQPADPASDDIWNAAVTKFKDGPLLDAAEAACLNTLLHLALPPAEMVKAGDWGAVIAFPDAELKEGAIAGRFGVPKLGSLLFEASPVKKGSAAYETSKPVLVRIGASCDFAQKKSGPVLYALGFIVPCDADLKEPMPKALIESPALQFPRHGKPALLFVNARFQVSLVESQVAAWEPVGRLREQLLMQIASHCASYTTRPGIVSIPPAEPDEPEEPETSADDAGVPSQKSN